MGGDPPSPSTGRRLRPIELFLAFSGIALTAFGQLIPIGRHALVVRHRWLTDAEFAEMLAVGQMLPGPNMVNLSAALGDRHAGWPGAIAAVGGLVVPPTILAVCFAATLYSFAQHPHVASAMSGMAAAACGLVLATALKLARASITRAAGVGVAIAIFLAVAIARLPLFLVLIVALPVSLMAHGVFRSRP